MVEVGAKVLCRFEKITALEVVTGNVNVGSLPTIRVGQVQGGVVEKFHSPKGANSSAWYVAVSTFATLCDKVTMCGRGSTRASKWSLRREFWMW